MKKKLYILLIILIITMFNSPLSSFSASTTYTKIGNVYPNIIGLGATDTISWTVQSTEIKNILVSQKGGSFLGVINIKPNGYYLKSSNVLRTEWFLTISAPFKIFNLEKGLYKKVVEYTLSTNGKITMTIISSKKIY